MVGSGGDINGENEIDEVSHVGETVEVGYDDAGEVG